MLQSRKGVKMKIYFGNVSKYQSLLSIILSMALVLAVVLTVSCQSEAPAPAPPYVPDEGTPLAPGEPEEPATPPQIEVIIQDSTFIPDTQNIPAGALVLWHNDDSVDHTVTARDNSFDSRRISPNQTFEYTFEQPGEVEYYCKIHPSMVGKITVE
jgi:plastocyanin